MRKLLPTSCPKPRARKAKAKAQGIARKFTLKKYGRIKPKPRTPGEFTRIYDSRARVRWVKAQPCAAQMIAELLGIVVAPNDVACLGAMENAHTENGGMGRKADAHTIIPLCHGHHRQYHRAVGVFASDEARRLARWHAAQIARRWEQLLFCNGARRVA